jgi:hypothetical protein
MFCEFKKHLDVLIMQTTMSRPVTSLISGGNPMQSCSDTCNQCADECRKMANM